MVALFSAATLPAQAIPCVADTFHTPVGAATPAVCAKPETKTEHPDWYRDGAYCTGGAEVSQVVTGFGQYSCKVDLDE